MIRLVSFGHGHGKPPAAEWSLDVRDMLRNPDPDPAFHQLDGHHLQVQARVLHTPGAHKVVVGIAQAAEMLADLRIDGTVAVGCAGGRHRAPVLVEAAARLLRAWDHEVTVEHRDIGRPVLRKAAS